MTTPRASKEVPEVEQQAAFVAPTPGDPTAWDPRKAPFPGTPIAFPKAGTDYPQSGTIYPPPT